MTKYIPETLKEINDNPKLIETMKGDAALTLLFKHAFDPNFKFVLPEGDAPYKPDSAPIGMTPAIFKQELKRLYVFCRTDLPAIRRETLYIQLLENIHPSEAEILVAVKDQKLTKMYPKITHELVYKAGFVQVPPPEKKVKEKKPKEETGKLKKIQGVAA